MQISVNATFSPSLVCVHDTGLWPQPYNIKDNGCRQKIDKRDIKKQRVVGKNFRVCHKYVFLSIGIAGATGSLRVWHAFRSHIIMSDVLTFYGHTGEDESGKVCHDIRRCYLN